MNVNGYCGVIHRLVAALGWYKEGQQHWCGFLIRRLQNFHSLTKVFKLSLGLQSFPL